MPERAPGVASGRASAPALPRNSPPWTPHRTDPFQRSPGFWLKLVSSVLAGLRGRSPSCIRSWPSAGAGYPRALPCTRSTYCMVLPGPGTTTRHHIGWLMHFAAGAASLPGAVCAAVVVHPSLLSWLLRRLWRHHLVGGCFYGIKPAVTAIVLQAAHRIGSRALRAFPGPSPAPPCRHLRPRTCRFRPSSSAPAWRVTCMAHRRPRFAAAAAATARPQVRSDRRFIDDHTPTPSHSLLLDAPGGVLAPRRPSGACRWRLAAWGGWQGARWRRSAGSSPRRRCSPSAVPTPCFPCLPGRSALRLAQRHADDRRPGLGETTPGPLIMVVAFVGSSAPCQGAVRPGRCSPAGAAGACVATWFTFLPRSCSSRAAGRW